MNNNYFTHAVLAIAMGVGAGTLLSVGAQQLLNNYHIKHCPSKPGHQLLYMQGLLSDSFYCLDKRTL